MRNFFTDKRIRNANVKHSWVVRIMDLPSEELRNNALKILTDWVYDEMDHLFGRSEKAVDVVLSTCVFLLENEALKAIDPECCSADYPQLNDALDAVYFYLFATGEPQEKDREKARIFLQLMKDGYMKPDVDKMLKMAESYEPGEKVNVSLRS